MPVHDWTQVPAGIYHDFHCEWLSSIKHALNDGILPAGYYSLAEQYAGNHGLDVLTLKGNPEPETLTARPEPSGRTLLTKPRQQPTAQTELAYYRQKQRVISVRHVSDDQVVAVIEVVSPANKKDAKHFRKFVEEATDFLDRMIHLMVIDILPPTRRDPNGIHGAIWDEFTGEAYQLPKRKRLTVASYEADLDVRAFVSHFAVGEPLPEMELFLERAGCVEVPLELTYQRAFDEVPKRWSDVLGEKAIRQQHTHDPEAADGAVRR